MRHMLSSLEATSDVQSWILVLSKLQKKSVRGNCMCFKWLLRKILGLTRKDRCRNVDIRMTSNISHQHCVVIQEDDSCNLATSSVWDMIVIHVLFYMDVSADSNLKQDRERDVWTISGMSAVFRTCLCRMLIDLPETGELVMCNMGCQNVTTTLSSCGHWRRRRSIS